MKIVFLSLITLFISFGVSAQSIEQSRTFVDKGDIHEATANKYLVNFNANSNGNTPYVTITMLDNMGVELAHAHFFNNESQALKKQPFENDKRVLQFQFSIDVLDAFKNAFDSNKKATIAYNVKNKEANILFKVNPNTRANNKPGGGIDASNSSSRQQISQPLKTSGQNTTNGKQIKLPKK